MAASVKAGISDITVYLPRPKINLETIIAKRAQENGAGSRLEKVLKRTVKCTGLLSMRFPELWEDSVTMAASAAHRLILRNGRLNLQALRYLAAGTETGVDHSKPVAAYVCGILKKAGHKIPLSLSTFQTQHACAGGTLALLGISALLAVTGPADESGIVMCSDIARYERRTTEEMTQGAGAVAMLVETDPKLIEFDLKTIGYSSRDVDDFFRPLGSDIAKVKGTYSIRCYMEAVESAFLNYCSRSKQAPEDALRATDLFAFHVPYPNLPLDTMRHMLHKYLGMNKSESQEFLDRRSFSSMVSPASKSGNIYSGSMYMSLAFLLKAHFDKIGPDIVGKNILMGSYGSGNTMVLMAGRICREAPEIIRGWDLEKLWQEENTSSVEEYERWACSNGTTPEAYQEALNSQVSRIGSKTFYLNRIREDGYREYLYRE